MSVGFPATKTEIDLRSGQAVVNLREAMDTVVRIKAWLDEHPQETDLTSLGYTAAEATLLRASFTDLSNLVSVGRGTRTQAAVNDFFFNARKLTALS